MSMQIFVAVNKPLQKTKYSYNMILPNIAEDDMFYNDKIIFNDELTEEELATLGDIFKGYRVYEVSSGFHFSYDPNYKRQLSERSAKNALDELKWLKCFVTKKLKNDGVFMLVNLWLGREYPFKRVNIEQIEVDSWELSEEKSFEFSYGTVYKFI